MGDVVEVLRLAVRTFYFGRFQSILPKEANLDWIQFSEDYSQIIIQDPKDKFYG